MPKAKDQNEMLLWVMGGVGLLLLLAIFWQQTNLLRSQVFLGGPQQTTIAPPAALTRGTIKSCYTFKADSTITCVLSSNAEKCRFAQSNRPGIYNLPSAQECVTDLEKTSSDDTGFYYRRVRLYSQQESGFTSTAGMTEDEFCRQQYSASINTLEVAPGCEVVKEAPAGFFKDGGGRSHCVMALKCSRSYI